MPIDSNGDAISGAGADADWRCDASPPLSCMSCHIMTCNEQMFVLIMRRWKGTDGKEGNLDCSLVSLVQTGQSLYLS
jgi:hypothetical protein